MSSFVDPSLLNEIKSNIQGRIQLERWVIYSLPGGLWLFSFACLTRPFFSSNKQVNYHLLLLLLCLTVVALELLQSLEVTDGTFDNVDLMFYGIAIMLSMVVNKIRGNRSKNFVIYKLGKNPNYLLSVVIGIFVFGIYLADVL